MGVGHSFVSKARVHQGGQKRENEHPIKLNQPWDREIQQLNVKRVGSDDSLHDREQIRNPPSLEQLEPVLLPRNRADRNGDHCEKERPDHGALHEEAELRDAASVHEERHRRSAGKLPDIALPRVSVRQRKGEVRG